jgi:hypothetical protein
MAQLDNYDSCMLPVDARENPTKVDDEVATQSWAPTA